MQEIYSMASGYLIYSCIEFNLMDTGHYSVQVSLLGWLIVGVKNLRPCTLNMRKR